MLRIALAKIFDNCTDMIFLLRSQSSNIKTLNPIQYFVVAPQQIVCANTKKIRNLF